jgi:hypothetical protein
MQRHPQWEARLQKALSAMNGKPYAWGEHDCLMLCAQVAKAVTGKDHARGHRGKYQSHASAYSYLKRTFDVESAEALLDKLFARKKVGFAGVGDLVLCRVDALAGAGGEPTPGDVPGVVVGPGDVAMVAGESGLERVPRGDRWLKAWAVGDHHSGEVADE